MTKSGRVARRPLCRGLGVCLFAAVTLAALTLYERRGYGGARPRHRHARVAEIRA